MESGGTQKVFVKARKKDVNAFTTATPLDAGARANWLKKNSHVGGIQRHEGVKKKGGTERGADVAANSLWEIFTILIGKNIREPDTSSNWRTRPWIPGK